MPPKKKGEVEEKMVLIGRMGTNLKVKAMAEVIIIISHTDVYYCRLV